MYEWRSVYQYFLLASELKKGDNYIIACCINQQLITINKQALFSGIGFEHISCFDC